MTKKAIKFDLSRLTPVPLSRNAQDRGIGEFGDFHPTAREFLESFEWHNGIVGDYFGGGAPGLAGAFLFEIVSRKRNVDKYLWVVAGKLPLA
jgi:hypothetical protein